MFSFKIEPEHALITVTRTGTWTLDTVADYEQAFRRELTSLLQTSGRIICIVDVRNAETMQDAVADAMKDIVARLGRLRAQRTAIVAKSGYYKFQAQRVPMADTRSFTSMVLARDWALGKREVSPLASSRTAA